jgi:23S rRNA (cytidine2498-2'-O)-methyltransferase
MLYLVTAASGFENEAKHEVLGFVKGKTRSLFMKGLFTLETEENAIEKLRNAETKYTGHVYPLQKELRISKSKESLKQIVEAVLEIDAIEKDETFKVFCERRGQHEFGSRDVCIAIAEKIKSKVDLEKPDRIVVVQIIQDLAFVSVVNPDDILAKVVLISKKYEERPLNRAEFKIKEALEEFRVEIKDNWRVLDIGAAPGGWTKVLSQKAKEVVAVDPGEMEFQAKNVKHMKIRSENLPKDIGKFDMLVDDMNLEPTESARIMCELSKYLKKGAVAIMTIKFVTIHREKHVREAIDVLSKRYNSFKTKRLQHNKFETTVFMKAGPTKKLGIF